MKETVSSDLAFLSPAPFIVIPCLNSLGRRWKQGPGARSPAAHNGDWQSAALTEPKLLSSRLTQHPLLTPTPSLPHIRFWDAEGSWQLFPGSQNSQLGKGPMFGNSPGSPLPPPCSLGNIYLCSDNVIHGCTHKLWAVQGHRELHRSSARTQDLLRSTPRFLCPCATSLHPLAVKKP